MGAAPALVVAIPRAVVLLRVARHQGPLQANGDRGPLGNPSTGCPDRGLHTLSRAAARNLTGDIPYALFALSGLVLWTLFSQTLMGASESLVTLSQLLQKVYFPRLLLPISAAGTTVLDFAFGLLVLLAAMLAMGFAPPLAVLALVPLTALAVTTALRSAFGRLRLNVRYRDVRYATPFFVQVWFFATPIIYSASLVPEQLRWLYYINPMTGVIGGFRWALLGQQFPGGCRLDLTHGGVRPLRQRFSTSGGWKRVCRCGLDDARHRDTTEGLGKMYRIGNEREKSRTLRDALTRRPVGPGAHPTPGLRDP